VFAWFLYLVNESKFIGYISYMVFAQKGNPFLYECNCIATVYMSEYCIPREDIVRERRGSYIGCVVGCIHSFVG
jgi:hypothetical protein